MNDSTIKLIFHEEWLGISTLTSLEGKELDDEIIKIEKHVNRRCKKISMEMIDQNFVPDVLIREKIVRVANSLDFTVNWNEYIEDFQYLHEDQVFKKLGYLLMRIQLKENNANGCKNSEIRPEIMQQVVFLIWYDLIKVFEKKFLFDEHTVPYAINVVSSLDPQSDIAWTKETINNHKQEIGKWVELYTGHFPDYHDELYDRRVESNLSNRTSEMHFINRNSGLIFMNETNYPKYFIKDEYTPDSTGYMYNTVLKTVIQIRTIGFAMVLINGEIDRDTHQLTTKEFTDKKPALIKDDLDKTNRLKMILQKTLAPFFTDLSRSHRQHYHTLLKHSVEINDIEKNWQMIASKLKSNTEELNSIFLDKQEEGNKRQEKILNMVNIILGASIIFEILGYLVPEENLNLVIKIVGGCFGALLVFLIGKLYLPKIFKRKKKKKKSKKNK